jgi:hypothetical protein
MKPLLHLLLWACLSGLTHAAELPRSDNPEQFKQEVIEYTISLVGVGIPRASEKPELWKAIKEDPRDWEAGLAEIIGTPEQYGMGETESALLMAILRNKGTDPRISAATVRLFEHTVQTSVERLDTVTDNPSVITGAKGRIGSRVAAMVRTDSPDVLQSILEYFNSPEADRLGTLEKVTPKYVAPALQEYGDLRNAEEALRVAAKLASMGKTDFASDIRRAAERIKKDAGDKNAATGTLSQDGTNHVPGTDDKDNASERLLWPWLAAGGALIAALLAYFRLKRTGT